MSRKKLQLLLFISFTSLLLITLAYADASNTDQAIHNLVLQAQSAMKKGKPQKAAEFFEQAVGLGENASAEIGLVRAYLQAGEFRKTIAFGSLVAAEHTDISETIALLAYLEDREGQTAQALAKLKQALKAQPSDVALIGAYTEILIDRTAIPQASQLLDDWIASNPPQGDIYRLRARAALAANLPTDVQFWRRKAILAYTADGNLSAAESLQNWLSNTHNLTELEATNSSSTQTTNKKNLSRWPSPDFAAFPLKYGSTSKSGNGFVVDQGRRIITYASLVKDNPSEISVRNGLGEIRKAGIEIVRPDLGLAVLKLTKAYPKAWSLDASASQTPEGVKFCFVMGYPVTDDFEASYPLIVPASVVRSDVGLGNLMQITSTIGSDSQSGSPVLDNSGKLIGMTLGKQEPLKGINDREKRLGKGVFAIRSAAFQNLVLKTVKAPKQIKPKVTQASNLAIEELYEKLQPAVVTIVATD
ncbi:MAG: tetratricopeptide repeat protein [Methylococcaceae bacterium]